MNNGYLICPKPNKPPIYDNLQKEFSLYLTKAKQNDAKGQFIVGFAYLNGLGTSINIDQGEHWLYRSASQGYAPAEALYGFTLLQKTKHLGMNSQKNKILHQQEFQEPLKWLKQSALQGDKTGKFSLGIYYLDTDNYNEGIRILNELATQGNDAISATTQVVLGDMSFHGDGSVQELTQAINWYKKALKQKPPIIYAAEAMIAMQFIYSSPGDLYDEKQAAYWEKRHAEFIKILSCGV